MKKKKKKRQLTRTRTDAYNPSVDFGKIRQLRKDRGFKKQSDAAAVAGWTQQDWSRIERGISRDPRLSTLVTVARVLGCKVADLLTE